MIDLKIISNNCNYCTNCFNGILCDHIVTGIRNDQVQKDSYQNSEHKLTLEKAEKICWGSEKAEEGLNTLKTDQWRSNIARRKCKYYIA